jgi:hypothetical protein
MFKVPAQNDALPLMAPGLAGAVIIETIKLCAADAPQESFAVTLIVPPVEPAVALIEFVVDVPVHPPGSVQV